MTPLTEKKSIRGPTFLSLMDETKKEKWKGKVLWLNENPILFSKDLCQRKALTIPKTAQNA